ncbi:proline-alanine-rich protein [Circulifer tenellus virus 1]|uniref:Proline-alanine-rich protein n=1 Tax=Circulifer tenellus virus 1 TaxID=862944 RepID=D9D9L9_9VIRU|nr:proline-alanine-rich protein [Circulifer tenellus virus 1]ADK12923.1 proline-alanine-rich protein [Circulifer tenellus virus 1]
MTPPPSVPQPPAHSRPEEGAKAPQTAPLGATPPLQPQGPLAGGAPSPLMGEHEPGTPSIEPNPTSRGLQLGALDDAPVPNLLEHNDLDQPTQSGESAEPPHQGALGVEPPLQAPPPQEEGEVRVVRHPSPSRSQSPDQPPPQPLPPLTQSDPITPPQSQPPSSPQPSRPPTPPPPSQPTQQELPHPPLPQQPHPLASRSAPHEKLLFRLIPTGSENWIHAVAGVAEKVAPALVAIGIGYAAPELLPFLPALSSEAEAAVLESAEAASAWAALRPSLIEQVNAQPPQTLGEALRQFQDQVGRPNLVRAPDQPLRLPTQAAEMRRKDVLASAPKYIQLMRQRHPYLFSNQVRHNNLHSAGADHHLRRREMPGARRVKPTHASPHRSLWAGEAQIGDHSIHGAGVSEELLVDMVFEGSATPNFFSRFGTTLRNQDGNFQNIAAAAGVANSGFQIGSGISLAANGGGLEPAHNIWGTVFPSHFGPRAAGAAPQGRHDIVVHAGGPREIGRFTASAISSFIQGGVPSERAVMSALSPYLRIPAANVNVARALVPLILSGWEYYDNSYLYAKLWFYVFLRDVYVAVGGNPPAVVPFPPNVHAPAWINLNGVNNVHTIPNAIDGKSICLVNDKDVFTGNPTDLQIIYWLTAAGSRLDGNAGQPTPDATYIQWEAINVTILAHADEAGAPQAALVSQSSIIDFIHRLATNRAEWSSALKGMYLALDILGIRYSDHDNEQWAVRSNLSPHNPWVPGPADYNFLLRWLLIFPDDPAESRYECNVAAQMAPQTRARVAALYNAAVSTFTTTLLFDLNLTKQHLLQWTTGDAELPPMAQTLFMEALNQYDQSTSPVEAFAMRQVHNAMGTFLGVHACSNLYPEDTWLGNFGQNPGAAVIYQDYGAQTVTLALLNPLVLTEWLTMFPFEWGVIGTQPTLNLAADVKNIGPPALQGWYAYRGSKFYNERVVGDFPVKIVVYGAQVINIISQHNRFGAAAVPAVQRQAADYYGQDASGTTPSWGPAQAIPDLAGFYDANIHIFRPCTVMSYDYVNGQVWSPALLNDNIGPGEAARLKYWTGQRVDNGGIFLPKVGGETAPVRLPAQLNLMRIGGMKSRKANEDAKATPNQDKAGEKPAAEASGAAVNP